MTIHQGPPDCERCSRAAAIWAAAQAAANEPAAQVAS